ncbi:MAG: HEAT repeat domain-containing protein [Candidatus Magnetoovum sp. WYHC-5]|nr:HEAT repeat domain-containing protein [Candidatus Magnetoovum sp. WYHC-5]
MYKNNNNTQQSFEEMVAEHMEHGFLENIIDMLKYEEDAYKVIKHLLRDERIRVRIGAVALVEEATALGLRFVDELADELLQLLDDENPLVRADAIYCLEMAGNMKHVPVLEKCMQKEENQQVKEAVDEAISEIKRRVVGNDDI